jgi:hypothetical protein
MAAPPCGALSPGDFDSDTHPDILWNNHITGEVKAWLLDGKGKVRSYLTLHLQCGPAQGCPATWHIVGAGDLDQDGQVDVILHNSSTGVVLAWILDKTGVVTNILTTKYTCDAASGCSDRMKFIGVADLNGDGIQDLLWYSKTSGAPMAVVLDRDGFVRVAVTVSKGCGSTPNCTVGWNPIGVMREYHPVNP